MICERGRTDTAYLPVVRRSVTAAAVARRSASRPKLRSSVRLPSVARAATTDALLENRVDRRGKWGEAGAGTNGKIFGAAAGGRHH